MLRSGVRISHGPPDDGHMRVNEDPAMWRGRVRRFAPQQSFALCGVKLRPGPLRHRSVSVRGCHNVPNSHERYHVLAEDGSNVAHQYEFLAEDGSKVARKWFLYRE